MAAAIPPRVSKIVDVFVSIAAAVVIWGALRKILHAPDADFWLKVGLTTEALVFLVYGILYLRYPAVDDGHGKKVAAAAPGDVLGSLDDAMSKADITPANLNRLGENFKKLNTTVSNMNDISDVVAATGDYTARTREVTAALSQVKEAYVGAANSVGAFNAASDGARIFHDQIQVLTGPHWVQKQEIAHVWTWYLGPDWARKRVTRNLPNNPGRPNDHGGVFADGRSRRHPAIQC